MSKCFFAKARPETKVLLSLPSIYELGLEQHTFDLFSVETEINPDRLILLIVRDKERVAKAAKEILEDSECILVTEAFHVAKSVI